MTIHDDLHQAIANAMKDRSPGQVVDALLGQCPDAECCECASIVCPHEDPMHFHHDGCPACASAEAFNSGGRD